MTFSLRLSAPAYPQRPITHADVAEDLVSLLIEGSRHLGEAGYTFEVRGFGDERWPTDVAYDLALLVEQLPEAIAALDAGEPTTIEFVGQGVERVVDLIPKGAALSARCRSGTAWVPSPDVEQLEVAVLLNTLRQLVRDYVAGLAEVVPVLAESESARELLRAASD